MAQKISGSTRGGQPVTPPPGKPPRRPTPKRTPRLPKNKHGKVGPGRADVNAQARGPRRTERNRKRRGELAERLALLANAAKQPQLRLAVHKLRRQHIAATRFGKLPKFDRIQIHLQAERYRRFAARKGVSLSDRLLREKARIMWEVKRERAGLRSAGYQNPALADSLPDGAMVLQAAMRRDPAMRRIAAVLGSSRDGRPTDRQLAVEVIMRNALEELPVELRRALMDFVAQCAPTLEWAYGEPYLPSSPEPLTQKQLKALEKLTGELIQGRKTWESRDGDRLERRVPGMLDLHDPAIVLDEMAGAYLRLHASGRWPRGLEVLSIDGTRMPVNRTQVQSVSHAHELEVNGRLLSAFGYHGPSDDGWRGFNGLLLAGVCGPPVAAGMKLIPARNREFKHAADLLADTYRRMRTQQPDFSELQILLGDREFHYREVAEPLLFDWSVRLITPWRGGTRNIAWGDNFGVPYCDLHRGRPSVDMRLVKAQGVWTPEQRAQRGVPLGEDLRQHLPKRDWPHLRWACPRCEAEHKKDPKAWPKVNTATTWAHRAPHIYTWHPYKNVHPRYAERLDLLGLRGASESLNSVLKHDCFALRAPKAPRCVQTERQMLWWAYLRNLRNVLKALVRENGSYDQVRDEMARKGLLTPGLLARMRAAGMELCDLPLGDEVVRRRPELYAVGAEGGDSDESDDEMLMAA
jgi:hypothetical protein